jgi:hypothetical protein
MPFKLHGSRRQVRASVRGAEPATQHTKDGVAMLSDLVRSWLQQRPSVTAIDGYQVAPKGRAGEALATTAWLVLRGHSRDRALPSLTRLSATLIHIQSAIQVVGRQQKH